MQKIFLGGKYGSIIGNFALVDDEYFEKCKLYKWFAHKHKSGNIYARVLVKQKDLYLHRFILSQVGKITDHKNHNTLDCTRDNLRICTASQNSANRITKRKYLGISFHKKYKKYSACCKKNGITYGIYSLETEDAAALAYNELALKHHGEFARLNIIPSLNP